MGKDNRELRESTIPSVRGRGIRIVSAEWFAAKQIANPRTQGVLTPSKFATCFGFPCVEIERNDKIGGQSDLQESVSQAGIAASNLPFGRKECLLGGFSGGVQHDRGPLRYTDRSNLSFFVAIVVTASED